MPAAATDLSLGSERASVLSLVRGPTAVPGVHMSGALAGGAAGTEEASHVGSHVGGGVLPLGLPSIDAVLPDGGLPRGAVVELSAPHGLARASTLALAACASAQAEARIRGAADTEGAWCAWIDCDGSLFAPAVVRAGVDATRLLVVRPQAEPTLLARVAVRVAQSGAFSLVVIDTTGMPGSARTPERLDRWATTVRRLALAVEHSPTTVLLLTDARAHRATPLPVAMRLELAQSMGSRATSLPHGGSRTTSLPLGGSMPSSASHGGSKREGAPALTLRVAKDRHGRVAAPVVVELGSEPGLRAARVRPATAPAVAAPLRVIGA